MAKFVNLSAKYKKLLDETSKLISTKDKDDLKNEKMTFKRLNQLYLSISALLENGECDIFDMNHLLNNYNKSNIIVDQLRSIVKQRNSIILDKAKKTEYWKNTLNKLNESLIKKLKIKTIEDTFLELLKKYENNWMGYWTIIEIDKQGEIKDINIIDEDDLVYFIDCLNNK